MACAGSAGSVGFSVVRLHATVQTQTIHMPLSCSQRHADNSRQTDLKLPVCIRIARFCHAPHYLSVTAKPRFKSFRAADVVGLPRSLPCARQNRSPAVRSVRVPFGRVVGGSLIELAVERGAAE